MRKLIIVLALAAILGGGCGPKETIVLDIPGTTAQIMMRLIPAGTYTMGSPDWEVDRSSNEGPDHIVHISNPFYIGIYEVTQDQWDKVMGNNPSEFPAAASPVESVSWNDCQDFISELNTMNIGTFRLPTEAEWEYACRAGSSTRYYFGDDPGYSEIGDYAWYDGNSSDTTHAVGQKEPNAWGLYDMHGNVWEWCSDWYDAYDSAQQIDPEGPSSGSNRVFRGGAWYNVPQFSRAAARSGVMPTYTDIHLGFRLVRTAP